MRRRAPLTAPHLTVHLTLRCGLILQRGLTPQTLRPPLTVHLEFQCGLTPFWHVAELLRLRKHAFIAYAGRMFEPFDLPVLEFVAFLRASAVL